MVTAKGQTIDGVGLGLRWDFIDEILELKPALHAERAMRRSWAPSAWPLCATSACVSARSWSNAAGLLNAFEYGSVPAPRLTLTTTTLSFACSMFACCHRPSPWKWTMRS